jgi:hypothetical protein
MEEGVCCDDVRAAFSYTGDRMHWKQETEMSDGREEREEREKRRELEEREDREDRLDRGRQDEWEPEHGGS